MQSWLPRSRLPVFRSAEAISGYLRNLERPTLALAAYSSDVGGIITDPVAMSVPIDDHGFHRGHCVFDTANVADGKAFGLSMHLDRLLGSARQARIETSGLEKDTLKRIILETVAATVSRDSFMNIMAPLAMATAEPAASSFGGRTGPLRVPIDDE